MKANVSTPDRIARILAGAPLIALAATGVIGVWGYIGLIPLATGFFRFGPGCLPFGINPCFADEAAK